MASSTGDASISIMQIHPLPVDSSSAFDPLWPDLLASVSRCRIAQPVLPEILVAFSIGFAIQSSATPHLASNMVASCRSVCSYRIRIRQHFRYSRKRLADGFPNPPASARDRGRIGSAFVPSRRGMTTAVRALAIEWIRIAFRCWKHAVPYTMTSVTCNAQSSPGAVCR